MDDIIDFVVKASPVPIWMTVLYGLFAYKKLNGELRIFCWFLFLSGFVQLLSSILWYKSINNMPLLHLYVTGGYICLAFFYQEVLKGFINPWIIGWSAVLLTAFAIINAIFFQNIYMFASNTLTVESILVIILALSTFTFLLNDMVKKKKTDIVKSLKWINYGLFIYFSSNLLIFYFGEIIIRTLSRNLNLYTWSLHTFFLMAMYFCFFMGIWHRPKT